MHLPHCKKKPTKGSKYKILIWWLHLGQNDLGESLFNSFVLFCKFDEVLNITAETKLPMLNKNKEYRNSSIVEKELKLFRLLKI